MARAKPGWRNGWAALALTIAAVVPLPAQPVQPEEPRREATLASLPQSNEALLLSNRAAQAMQAGDYRLAIELLDKIRSLAGELVAAPASRTFYPVWRQASLLAARMPPDGVELYRQLRDGEVETRFRVASEQADVAVLRSLFREYRLSQHWPAIADELAALLLDRGRFGQALEIINEVEAAGLPATPARLARKAVALKMLAAGATADAALEELRGSIGESADAWRARLQAIENWSGERAASAGAGEPYALDAAPIWTQFLGAAGESAAGEEERRLGQAIAAKQRLPLLEPVLAGDRLVVRAGGRVHAFDALTLAPLWSVDELPAPDARAGAPNVGEIPGSGDRSLDPAAVMLLTNHLRHVLAADGERTYTVEALTLSDSGDDLTQRPFAAANPSIYSNELVARSLDTGEVVWHSGEDPTADLAGAEFLDRPLCLGDRLLAPVRLVEEQHLVELDPASGALLRSVRIVGPPAHFTRAGGRSLLTHDATTVYMSTGVGVIAALSLDDLSWKWATAYPSTVSEHIGRLWWKPAAPPSESTIDRMFVAEDLLIAAPIDSTEILALDRFTGRERWRLPRRDANFVAGAVPGGLIVGSNGVLCLDLADPLGRPIRWRSVPLDVVGRPAVRGDRVYVPCASGLAVLDGVSGKLLAEQGADAERASGYGGAGANLLLTEAACYRVSPMRVTKYPAVEQTRAACAALSATEPARAQVGLAWLEALTGAADSALARLENLPAEAQALGAGRLRSIVFDELAAGAQDEQTRLAWLRRAAESAPAGESRARLEMRVGQTLEALQKPDEAAACYAALIAMADPAELALDERGTARRSAWLEAVRRLEALANKAGASEAVGEAIGRWSGQDEAGLIALQRILPALPPGEARSRAARALIAARWPPELKFAWLPDATDDPQLPEAERRRLQLDRWETVVALDELESAAIEEQVWRDRFGGAAEAVSEPQQAEESDLVDAIRLAQRKLADANAAPLGETLYRQWKITTAELALDPHWLTDPQRRWMLVYELQLGELQLVHCQRPPNPQRRFVAALRRGGPPTDPQFLLGGAALVWNQAQRYYWPIAAARHLAAFPVAGGLVGVGLGPERGGGKRLWELAVPEWAAPPENFGDLAAAGGQGVYVTPRPDRVQLVAWADGSTAWVTDVPGAAFERVRLAGDRVVAFTADRRALVFDARWGGVPAEVDFAGPSPLGVDLVAGQIVAWGSQFAAGYDPRTLERRWLRDIVGSGDAVPVAGAPWLAVRVADSDRWTLIDVRDGALVLEAFGPMLRLDAIALVGDRIYAAGREPGEQEDESASGLAVVRCVSGEGRVVWESRRRSQQRVNVSQLVGHPDLIPVFIERWQRDEPGAEPGAAIQLIRRIDGTSPPPMSITADYKPERGVSEVTLFVTPTRILLHVDGNTLAYGASATGEDD